MRVVAALLTRYKKRLVIHNVVATILLGLNGQDVLLPAVLVINHVIFETVMVKSFKPNESFAPILLFLKTGPNGRSAQYLAVVVLKSGSDLSPALEEKFKRLDARRELVRSGISGLCGLLVVRLVVRGSEQGKREIFEMKFF